MTSSLNENEKDVQANNVASNPDEMMLKELERRDGIYSFIFHELEKPPTPLVEPTSNEDEILLNDCSTRNEQMIVFITESILSTNAGVTISDDVCSTKNNLNTASPTSSSSSSSLASVSPLSSSLSPLSSSSSSPLSLLTLSSPSLSTTTTTLSSSFFFETPKDHNMLPDNGPMTKKQKLCSDYHTTFGRPGSFLCDYANIYDFMTPSKFRVRVALPGFSHITTPLERNRCHPLKETPEYKRGIAAGSDGKVPDLRALFPYDPDVHAPFAKTTKIKDES